MYCAISSSSLLLYSVLFDWQSSKILNHIGLGHYKIRSNKTGAVNEILALGVGIRKQYHILLSDTNSESQDFIHSTGFIYCQYDKVHI